MISPIELVHSVATTHSLDTSQRLVDMPLEREGFCPLKACVPEEPNVAPRGWCMLFVVDKRRVPSLASWMHLQPIESPAPAPRPQPTPQRKKPARSQARKRPKRPSPPPTTTTRKEHAHHSHN